MRYLLVLTIATACGTPLAAADLDLKPAKTYVVVAGVLQWSGGLLRGFPTKNRKDEELYDTLRAAGVPAENMKLLLDEQATYSGVKRAVREIGAKADKDSLFVFYYCGHGQPCAKADVCLANYDLRPNQPERTGLTGSDLAKMLKDNFKGKRVLLLADCCYSGGLAKVAEELHAAGYEAANLTSANDSTISTGNWTFTQTVIDALTGDTFADANGDGVVTLDELANDVKRSMEALERQRHGFKAYGLKGGMTLATVTKKAKADGAKFPPGDFVLAPDGNRTRVGRVVGGEKGKAVVQFYDYTEKRRVELADTKVTALPKDWLVGAAGQKVEVLWSQNWFPAYVLLTSGDQSYIQYEGYDDDWNEWVGPDRIRPVTKK